MTDAHRTAKTIDDFCAANFRGSYECRPHAQLFPRGALEIATMSDDWPRLRNTMEQLIGQPDFFSPRISMTVAVQERELHAALMVALQELAVAAPGSALASLHQVVDEIDLMQWRAGKKEKPDALRLAAWDALFFIRSSKPQN
jgi:hypothetical protein